MKSVSLNQDLGGGWRLVSITLTDSASRTLILVLTQGGKTYTVRFAPNTAQLLDSSPTLTAAQLHTIQTAAIQFLK